MITNFGATHQRLTRTSSDLRILSASLFPPSPILKPVDLLISSTSGEIPILLQLAVAFDEPTEICDVAKDSKLRSSSNPDIPRPAGPTTRNCRGNEPPFEIQTQEGNSDEVFRIAELSDTHHATEFPHNSSRCAAVGFDSRESPMTFTGRAANDVRLLDHKLGSLVSKAQGTDFEAFLARDPRGCCLAQDDTRRDPSSDALEANPDSNQLQTISMFHTYATLPTPTFAPPSPSPSVDLISLTSPIGRQRHRRPLERAGAVRFHGRPRSPRLQANEVESNVLSSSPQASPTRKPAAHPRWQLIDSPSGLSTFSSSSSGSHAIHMFVQHPGLPEEFSWLKNVTIELWIDQEGFRAVKPAMQLMGYSPRSRSLHPYDTTEKAGSDITAGVAEFMPTKRETFAFHYSTLDTPPTLRMVSVGGDESRDFISRQATLSVKANGVYTVLGTEMFLASILHGDTPGSRYENMRLRWKFDYLVSDRKVDATGKTLPGEKTLTPLTFSCSPYLFHPLQGKKTGLMHIMKKSLVPKLGSQKLEPPVYAPIHRIPQQLSRRISAWRDASTHSRSRSDASAKGGHYLSTRCPPDVGARGGTIRSTNQMQNARRRRASSAGEHSLAFPINETVHRGIITSNRAPALLPIAVLHTALPRIIDSSE